MRRHQRQRQSRENRQRQLQHRLTTAVSVRCVWWHDARVSHLYRVNMLASLSVVHCVLLPCLLGAQSDARFLLNDALYT